MQRDRGGGGDVQRVGAGAIGMRTRTSAAASAAAAEAGPLGTDEQREPPGCGDVVDVGVAVG